MDQKTVSSRVVRRLCAWPIAAAMLALPHVAGPAHALFEVGSSAPPPVIETVAATLPDRGLWLSPAARAREDWRRSVCTGMPGAIWHRDAPYDMPLRSADGTILHAAMAPVLISEVRDGPIRPTRRPSYILAQHLIPRDPATVRPVKRPKVKLASSRHYHIWQDAHAIPAANFGDGLWGDTDASALWRAYLCNDADGTMAIARGGFDPDLIIARAAATAPQQPILRRTGRDGRPSSPRGFGGGPGGGGSGGPSGQPFVLFPVAGPGGASSGPILGGPVPGDPAFQPGSTPPGGGNGPGNGPGHGPGPGGPPLNPGGPPAAQPAPVPLPAPLLLLLTACAGLLFGRRFVGLWRR